MNFLNHEIVEFLVRLNNEKVSERDHDYLSGALHTVSDLERVGDYAENIVEYAESLKNADEKFSAAAVAEIDRAGTMVNRLYEDVIKAYKNKDADALARALRTEDEIDDFTNQMTENHIKRLHEKKCSPDVGSQYISLASNTERVADHFMNMGNAIKSQLGA